MTKSIKLRAVIILVLLLGPIAMAQQDCTDFSITRTIQLDASSKTKEIKLEVNDDVKCLQIGLISTIESGALTIEIYDPNGDKQGNFSVESGLSSSSSSAGKNKDLVCGQLNKTIKDPMKGNWIVKLKPKKVTGEIMINSRQSQ